MIVAIDRCRTVPLLPLLQTLFDIALLRKGPEHIPRSVVMLVMAIVFWLLVRLAMLVFDEGFDEYSFIIELFSAFLAAVCYSAVIIISGQRPRLLQSLSAIIGISGTNESDVPVGENAAAVCCRCRIHVARSLGDYSVVGFG